MRIEQSIIPPFHSPYVCEGKDYMQNGILVVPSECKEYCQVDGVA